MEQELFQNGQPILTNDLNNAQADLEDALVKRFTDSFSSGILQNALNQFAITVNVGNHNLIDIATGVGYDPKGQRVSITSATDLYAAAYVTGSTQTSGIPFTYGVPNGPLTYTNNGLPGPQYTLTPQNSGCQGIPLFAGDYNYIWIGYLQTTDPNIFVLQNLTNLRLFTSAYDGYQIVVVGSPTVVTNPSTLNPDQTNFSYIYLGYVNNTAYPTPLSAGNINTNGRTFYSLENDRLLAIVPATDADRTITYTYGQSVNLQDHVGALGNGVVTPENPHGMNLSDLSGVGTTVAQLLETAFTSGIAGTDLSSLSFNVDTGDHPGNPAWGVNGFEVTPLLSDSTLYVQGVTMASTGVLGFGAEFFMASAGGTILPTDVYTIYVDSVSQSLKMAGAAGGAGQSYQVQVNSVLSSGITVITSSLTSPDFPLWSFTFNNGTGAISGVTDLRIFGNVGSASLAHSSATNTFIIPYNLSVSGSISTSSTFNAPTVNATTVVEQGGFPLVPAGSINAYGGSTAPGGWLICNGQSYPTSTYPNLFAAVGYNWGGTGANFNVPDLRGVFLRGANNMGTGDATDSFADPDAASRVTRLSGGETGDNVGSFQLDDVVAHTHDVIGAASSSPAYASGGSDSPAHASVETTFTQTPTGGNETRSKNAYVMYIIKF